MCFPLDVVRTRLMAAGGPRYGRGPLPTLLGILRNEGAGALYSGCLPAVFGMAPAGAVFYGEPAFWGTYVCVVVRCGSLGSCRMVCLFCCTGCGLCVGCALCLLCV